MLEEDKYPVVGEYELTTLDGLFGEAMDALRNRVGVMKIDVEGFEPHVSVAGTPGSDFCSFFTRQPSKTRLRMPL